MRLFDLEIQAVIGEPITHLWVWWIAGERTPDNIVKTGDLSRVRLFEAYRDAVIWAAKEGPLDLANQVVALHDLGYQQG